MNKLLKSCPEFAAKSELFHRHNAGQHQPFEIERLKQVSDGVVTDRESFRAWRRHHPVETLEALHDAWKSKIVAFKLFPAHLPHKVIEKQFFSRDDMAFAVLRRRPIESFISGIKARHVGRFTKEDTTEIKPELSAEEFLEWAHKMRPWYKWVGKSLQTRGISFAEIGYERHLDGFSGEESVAHIRELLTPLGISQVTTPSKVIEGHRQDKETDYKSRIANWDAFVAELRVSPNSAKMFNWAERIYES